MIFGLRLTLKNFQTKLFILYKKQFVATGNLGSIIRQQNMKEEIVDEVRLETDLKPSKRSLETIDDGKNEAGVAVLVKRPRSQKKKKFAILMSYCGQSYLGMQFNHGFKTVEGELFQAFSKLEIMDEESLKFPQTIHFQRAARTDKGVIIYNVCF